MKEALVGFSRNIVLLDFSNVTLNCKSVINPYDPKNIADCGLKSGSKVGSLIINFTIKFPEEISEELRLILSEKMI